MKKTLIYIVVALILVGLGAYKIASNKANQKKEVAEVAKQVDKINEAAHKRGLLSEDERHEAVVAQWQKCCPSLRGWAVCACVMPC